jgi:hypothetical protein
MDLAVPWTTVSKPKFLHWFSPLLKHYIRKKNYRKHTGTVLQ